MKRSLVSLLVLLPLVFTAGTTDYVRVRLEAPSPSPFRTISYEVTRRAPATTAVHRRLLPGDAESLHALGLLTEAETATIDAVVRETDAMHLPDAGPATPAAGWGQLTWVVSLQVDGVLHEFRCTAPENLPDRRYFRLIDAVRTTVKGVTSELPFRNVFYEPERRGWVNIISVPAARATIDGFDTQLETPLYHYELASGAHTIRLKSTDGRFEREYKVKVEPGGTTQLRVDLR
ncbi:MAG: hypothetical protein EP329_19150 [Deltaproteobacteria bacterium]|nr:MAG: hypothetical protein EP329_19150 [Deltaproteobacteria bacterium]